MKGPAILLLHTLKRWRVVVVTLGALLSVFQLLLINLAASYERSGSFADLANLIPPFIRELLGPSIASFLSFGGQVTLGYFHPIVLASLVGLMIAVATGLVAEMESGFMDLVLSRPLERHWIITRTIVASAVCAAILLGMMLVATNVGLRVFAPKSAVPPSPALLSSLAASLLFLMLCWSGIALLIASGAQRRGAAGWIAGLLALATFLIDYLGRAWPAMAPLTWVSPFRYYTPLELIMGQPLTLSNLCVLGGIAVVSWALSYVVFLRRDIAH